MERQRPIEPCTSRHAHTGSEAHKCQDPANGQVNLTPEQEVVKAAQQWSKKQCA